MKVYKAYHIQSVEDGIVGLLSQFAFESFEERDDMMIAYIPEDECDEQTIKEIKETIDRFGVSFEIETIQPQNWNALWESSFEPVIVDDFCAVRADFHDKIAGVEHDIVINPKMAFGTGHHETTYMMMNAMRSMDHEGKSVFDYGCGTGVLAILASKLGANQIDAIDIEEESYENTIENCEINAVSNVTTQCSDLPSFEAKVYDIILANINRNVLLASADDLYSRLSADGTILLSGILEEDHDLVADCYIRAGFDIKETFSRGYWKCIYLTR